MRLLLLLLLLLEVLLLQLLLQLLLELLLRAAVLLLRPRRRRTRARIREPGAVVEEALHRVLVEPRGHGFQEPHVLPGDLVVGEVEDEAAWIIPAAAAAAAAPRPLAASASVVLPHSSLRRRDQALEVPSARKEVVGRGTRPDVGDEDRSRLQHLRRQGLVCHRRTVVEPPRGRRARRRGLLTRRRGKRSRGKRSRGGGRGTDPGRGVEHVGVVRQQPRLQEKVDQARVVPVAPDDELGGRAEGLDDEGAVGRGDDLVVL